MVTYKKRFCSVTCTLLDTVTGNTEEGVFKVSRPIKVFNERTKSRVLKEVNTTLSAEKENLKAIFIKEYENGEVTLGMEVDEFMKYAVELKEDVKEDK